MTAAEKIEREVAREEEERQSYQRLRVAVLRIVGKPPRLVDVSVSRVFDDYYRVNVLTAHEAASELLRSTQTRIEDSYFIRFDGDRVKWSNPRLVRKYEPCTA